MRRVRGHLMSPIRDSRGRAAQTPRAAAMCYEPHYNGISVAREAGSGMGSEAAAVRVKRGGARALRGAPIAARIKQERTDDVSAFDEDDAEQPKVRVPVQIVQSIYDRVAALAPRSKTPSPPKPNRQRKPKSKVPSIAAELMRTGLVVTEWHRKNAEHLRALRYEEESLRAFFLRLLNAGAKALPRKDE